VWIMQSQSNVKQLIKILVGVAWIDGSVQPAEQQYLQRIAQEHDLADDQELKPWLYQLRAVSQPECYRWIEDYLGTNPTSEACNQLIEAISGLIYSDGEIASEESKLVTRLLKIDASPETSKQVYPDLLQAVKNLYQRWVAKIQQSG
jgi:uncharacterized tellurite resistance protein B-like protein